MLAQHCSALQKVKPDGRDLTMQHLFPMHSAIPLRGPHPQQLYASNNATSSPLCPDQASFALCVRAEDGTGGIGVDPVFQIWSNMFNVDLTGQEDLYYNISQVPQACRIASMLVSLPSRHCKSHVLNALLIVHTF